MAINRRLKQLQALNLFEWQVLLQAMLLLPAVALVLKTKGLKYTQDMLTNQFTSSSQMMAPESGQINRAQSIARLVSIAANHGLYRTNCLKTSLATWGLLRRQGIISRLVIGVNKDSENLSAHAWVEYQGKALNQATDVEEQYSAFSSPDSP